MSKLIIRDMLKPMLVENTFGHIGDHRMIESIIFFVFSKCVEFKMVVLQTQIYSEEYCHLLFNIMVIWKR